MFPAESIFLIQQKLGKKIVSEKSVGGGCIADSRVIQTENGKKYFYKSYTGNNKKILSCEANGLNELSKANAIRIPKVILCENSFLLIEFIEEGRRQKDFWEMFGRQFAEMHRFHSEQFGFYENNFIGSNPQKNLPVMKNWVEFYWNHRLEYQYELAERNGYSNPEFRNLMNKLNGKIESIISGSEERPSILHGDLWSGNYLVDENGCPVLIDPAVYYGHREADLGMTALFGGFDSKFYDAYNEAYPLEEGWKYRVDLYKLYHVMNHLNLFGTGYYAQTISILKKYTS